MEYTIENLLTKLDKAKKLNLIHSYVVTDDTVIIRYHMKVGGVSGRWYSRAVPQYIKIAMNKLDRVTTKTITISEKNIHTLSNGDIIKLACDDTVVFKGHDGNNKDHARLDMGGHGFNVTTSIPYQMLYGLKAKIDLLESPFKSPFDKTILQQLREWNK